MGPAGIDHVAPLEHPGYYVRCEFQSGPSDLLSAPSSSGILAALAKHMTWAFNPGTSRMDLRQMGLLFLLLATAILLSGVAGGMSLGLAVGLLYVLVDPGYLLFFNSFYADGALILGLLGVVVWLERGGELAEYFWIQPTPVWVLWLASLCLLTAVGSGSKMQYVPLPAVVLAAMAPSLLSHLPAAPHRAAVIASLLILITIGISWNFFFGRGPRFDAYNSYHAVFGGILTASSAPEHVLADLKIPQEYWGLPRTDAWSAQVGVDHPVHASLRQLSRWKLLKHYLLDWHAGGTALSRIGSDLALVATHPRGNWVRQAVDRGPVKRVYEVPWQFSRVIRRVLVFWPPLIWLMLVSAVSWLARSAWRGRWRGIHVASLFLALWAITQFGVVVLGEGFVNLHQHLLGARFALDLLLVLMGVELLRALSTFNRERRETVRTAIVPIQGVNG